MGMRERRTAQDTERIVRQALEEGFHPSFRHVAAELSAWQEEHDPSEPMTRKQDVYEGEVIERGFIEELFHNLQGDVDLLTAEAVSQTEEYMRDFEALRNERLSIEAKIQLATQKLKKILLMTKGSPGEQYEVFTAIPDGGFSSKGSAFVDTMSRSVRLMENTSKSGGINLKNATFSIQSLVKDYRDVALTNPSYAVDGNINTAWWHVIKTKDAGNKEAKVELALIIDLQQEETFTQLRLDPHHARTMEVLAMHSKDGTTYETFGGNREAFVFQEETTIQFPLTTCRYIKLIFAKNTHDEQSAGFYQYYFGLRELTVIRQSFVSSGLSYTEPRQMLPSVSEVAIEVDHEVPVGADIVYSVAEVNPIQSDESWTWIPISPVGSGDTRFSQVVSLSKAKEMICEYNRADKSGEVVNGEVAYRLERTDGLIEIPGEDGQPIEDVRLYRGVGQWKVEQAYAPFTSDIPLKATFPEQARNYFIPFENELELRRAIGSKDNLYKFTSCFFSDMERTQPLSIGVIHREAGPETRVATYSVYVNGARLPFESDTYELKIQKGWNTVELLFHLGDVRNRIEFDDTELPSVVYVGRWNVGAERLVRGEIEAMRQVSKLELYAQDDLTMENSFALDQRQVFIRTEKAGVLYQLLYAQSSEESPKIAVRAELKRGMDEYQTPRIKEILLKGSGK